MKNSIKILFFLFVILSSSLFAQAPDSLWSGKFTPAGVNGPVRALEWDFSSMLVGGDFRHLTGNIDFAGRILRWQFVQEYIDFIVPGTENESDHVYDIEKVEDLDLTFVGGDFEIYSNEYDLFHLAVLDENDDWHTLSGDSTDGFNGPVRTLLWVQDKLYIGGEFTEVAGMQAHGFVMWDSANGFTTPGEQIDPFGFSGAVYDLQETGSFGSYDIIVAGNFTRAGLQIANNIASYDPYFDEWQTMTGGGTDGTVYALEINQYSASIDEKLVVGGNFSNAGALAAENLAIYDLFDSTWKQLGSGGGTNGIVYTINYPRSGGVNVNQVLIGGAFDTVDGNATGPLVGYSLLADEWRDMNIDIDGVVYEISDGRYSQYFAIGGEFEFIEDSAYVNNVFMLGVSGTDTTWYPTGYAPVDYGSPSIGIQDVAVDDSGNVYIVGGCDYAGGTKLNGVGMYDGDRWYPLGEGVSGGTALRIAVTGDTVYIGGSFDSVSGVPADRIAMWNGSSWEALGLGLPFGNIRAMEVDLEGNLWVGGFIDSAGTIPVTGIAVWDGTEWTQPGDTLYRTGSASVAIFDIEVDTLTGDVWVVGQVSGFGNISSNGAMRWDGSMWFAEGGDIGSPRSITFGPSGNPVIVTPFGSDLFEQINGQWISYAGGARASNGRLFTYGCDMFLGGDWLHEVNGEIIGPVARWNGVVWDSITTVDNISLSGVFDITEANEQLIVVGSFHHAGSYDNISHGFAIWDGLRKPGVIPQFIFSSPGAGDTLSFGTVFELDWVYNDSNTIENVTIEISYDSGATWQPIHSRAPIDRGFLPWLVPDTNVQYCKIRISDAELPCAAYVPDYTFEIQSDSTLESWWLTRKANTYYYEPFLPEYNGMSFGNVKSNMWPDSLAESIDYSDFNNPPDTMENFPDWYNFARAFGSEYSYKNGDPTRRRLAALLKWRATLTEWGGSCLGFSKASLVWFYGDVFNTDIILPYEPLVNLGYSDFTRSAANTHWIYQNGKKHIKQNKDASDLPVHETMQLIKESFTANYARTLSFTFASSKEKTNKDSVVVDTVWSASGHNVVPYWIHNVVDTPGVYYMYYYDSNDPLSRNEWVRIDSVNGKWFNPNYYPVDTNSRFMPRFPISEYFGFANDGQVSNLDYKSASSHFAEVYTSKTEEILISDSSGNQVGCVDYKEVINNLDAAPIYTDDPEYPYNYPPGYILPAGEYQISLTKFEGADTEISWFDEDSLIHIYDRINTDSSETDILTVSDALGVINPDTVVKTTSLSTMRTYGTSDRFVQINDWIMAQNDTSSVLLDSSSNVVITNIGSAKEYSVILWNSGDTVDSYTQSLVPISLASGGTHKVLPDWELLESGSLDIAVDADNDGIYEDTIVADVATDITDNSDNLLPERFQLNQNYPNPFNPTTTISFSLPAKSDVKLVVYNVLGQRVKTLVDETRAAGEHLVEWDGTTERGTKVSSGIYFYRITTDAYTASKKMLLLK